MNKLVNKLGVTAFAVAVAFEVLAMQTPIKSLTLADRGQEPTYTIETGGSESPAIKHAAEELQGYFRKISGVELPISASADGKRVRFAVKGGMGVSEFRVFADGLDLVVEGGSERAILYGIYDFLENELGCEWLTPDQEIVPERERIEVGLDYERHGVPAFEIRECDFNAMNTCQDYALKMKLDGYLHSPKWKPEHGGPHPQFMRDPVWCHTMECYLPQKKYLKDHPEYFMLWKGKREPLDFGEEKRINACLTNPDVLRIVTEGVLTRVRKLYPKYKSYMVAQNDVWAYCQCERCKAIDDREESQAGTNIEFVNKVADAVAKEFPDVVICTFAYQFTRKPPKTVKPRDNVVVWICDDTCDFSRPFRYEEFDKLVGRWKKIAKHVHFWDYTMNFEYTFAPFPCLRATKENYMELRNLGVTRLFAEGTTRRFQNEQALKTFVVGHLLWDPDQPLDPLIDRFCRGYYGVAAPLMRNYLNGLYAVSEARDRGTGRKNRMRMWGTSYKDEAIPTEYLERAADIMTAAAESVKDDPVRLRNVQWERNNNYLTLILRAKDPAESPRAKEYAEAARQILDDWDHYKRNCPFYPKRAKEVRAKLQALTK